MDKRILSFDKFKSHCNDIFDNKYDYSKSEYKGMKHPIKIVCPIHVIDYEGKDPEACEYYTEVVNVIK